MEYFIIGERELVLAFALVGVKGAYASNRTQALDAFNKVTGQSGLVSAQLSSGLPKVLILTEDVSVMLEDEVKKWQLGGRYPLIVEIPGLAGKIAGKKSLTDSIREAVGIRV
ncbi:V-type ATP synthase subunit F [Treponema sp.]|uniref:V-type ATP synthase subunit F n=1 Tax=Treponema sp. TaxID=166 RepID=UPI00298D8175|nr:V-type ATP synthase subunit F [Treponema sp.]MCR5613633.1 V-type ATP synthase subunit F [Treponema sp.]